MAIPTLIEHVIRSADRGHPADGALRQELKAQRFLPPEEAAEISRAVFTYYRWRGWLDERTPLHEQIERALQLGQRFQAQPRTFPDSDLIARAVPAWLKDEMEITPNWVRTLQAEPKLWLRARAGQGSALAGKLGDCYVFGDGMLGDTLEYRGRKDLFRTPEFHAGEFEVQDLSSQAVGLLCAARAAETWWDACAGEGGKLLHLSALMENKGLIWASDRAAWRLQKLKRRAARAKAFNYRSALWNGGPRLPTKTNFDGVLLDAPCSGIGTWHRNPHARWTTTPQDVKELGGLQKQLLENAAPSVKPGGRLVYAACTLTRSETTAVVRFFEEKLPDFKPLALTNPLQPSSPAAAGLYLWPQQSGGNGMFIAAWIRAR
ncbi:MAG TPA: RsmB/NOP family class I SAM-dependent RNA methyltransferase [Candidatus Binatia bacterium]|jgi:16S rRNA (cytosine967-C5)-methyltransferase|nr:RsmB/NOP family class I SAM-dependent RNA methyltransferase [Candidatus Binatia bacterium]